MSNTSIKIITHYADTDIHNISDYCTDTIYQIVTDRFLNKNNKSFEKLGHKELYDPENPYKHHGGNWQGIIQKIKDGYFDDLGVSAIWISPGTENIDAILEIGNVKVTSYHGYWNRDWFRTNPYFGTWDDFKTLCNVAHEHKIKIIIDFVLNHTSNINPFDDKYQKMENGRIFRDGKLIADYTKDEPDEYGCKFNHYGLFKNDKHQLENTQYAALADLADLNQMHPVIDQYLKDAIKVWLDAGADGIRLDAIAHMPKGWFTNWQVNTFSHKPVLMFGEYFLDQHIWFPENDSFYASFTRKSRIDCFNFPITWAVSDIFDTSKHNPLSRMKDVNEHQDSYVKNRIVTKLNFLDNHDMRRFIELCKTETKLAQALVLIMTIRGIPVIQYGTEQLMSGIRDPECRKDMDWTKDFSNTQPYKVIKQLTRIRKANKALAYGNLSTLFAKDEAYIFERTFVKNVVLVALNKSETVTYNVNIKTSLPDGTYQDIFNDIKIIVAKNSATIVLPPSKYLVWNFTSQDNEIRIGSVQPLVCLPNDLITIVGQGFGNDIGTVLLSEVKAEVVNWSDSFIQIRCPNIEGKRHVVKVHNISNNSAEYDNIKVYSSKQIASRINVKNVEVSPNTNLFIVGNSSELGMDGKGEPIGPFLKDLAAHQNDWFCDIHLPINSKMKIKFIIKDYSRNTLSESNVFELNTNDKIQTFEYKNLFWTPINSIKE